MRVALLCPGPSLATWPVETFAAYDLRMAVNRAILYAPCEAWTALDWKTVCRHSDPRPCILFTDKDCADTLRSKWARYGEFDVRIRPRRGVYSAINALHNCADLGARTIDVYGADWTTEPDFDGRDIPGTIRDANRWAGERAQWDEAIAQLQLEVKRLGPYRLSPQP